MGLCAYLQLQARIWKSFTQIFSEFSGIFWNKVLSAMRTIICQFIKSYLTFLKLVIFSFLWHCAAEASIQLWGNFGGFTVVCCAVELRFFLLNMKGYLQYFVKPYGNVIEHYRYLVDGDVRQILVFWNYFTLYLCLFIFTACYSMCLLAHKHSPQTLHADHKVRSIVAYCRH